MSRLDLNKYRINAEYIVETARNHTGDRKYLISRLAVANHIPILAVACYIGEELGFDDELKETVLRYMKFYEIEGIDNGKEITWLGKGHPVRCACSDCVDLEEIQGDSNGSGD